MRYLALVALLAGFMPAGAAAQPPVAVAGQSFAWDYLDADVASGAVVRFEIRIDQDDATLTDAGMSRIGTAESYSTPIPALTSGDHTWDVRACSAVLCSDPTPPFAFAFAAVVAAVDASSMRIIATPDP